MCHLPTMGQMAHQNTQPQRPAEAHRAIPKVGDEKEEQLYPNGALSQKLRLNLTEKDLLRLLP